MICSYEQFDGPNEFAATLLEEISKECTTKEFDSKIREESLSNCIIISTIREVYPMVCNFKKVKNYPHMVLTMGSMGKKEWEESVNQK